MEPRWDVFLIEEEAAHPDLDPGIAPLLTQMAYASKIIGREVGRAALVGKLGLMGEKNATGDSQKKLDVFGSEDGAGGVFVDWPGLCDGL